MTRTRKLAALLLLVAVVAVSVLTAALATDNTKTYAYLPDHSVYFYDVAEGYAWAHREIDTLAMNGGSTLNGTTQSTSPAKFILKGNEIYQMLITKLTE